MNAPDVNRSSPPMVAVNGRYLQKTPTGTQRYAREIVRRLGAGAQVLVGHARLGPAGHLWEQTVLPLRAAGRVLWSPCNTGPLTHRRHVVTIHDTAFVDVPECFSRGFVRWYRSLVPLLARRAARVITVSAFSKGRIAELFGVPPDRITVIHNGVDERFGRATEHDVARARARHGLTGPYILAVGSVEPRKNVARLLQAWSRTAAQRDGLTLAVAGARGITCFADAGDLSTHPSVRWLGYVADEDLPGLYAGASAFVFPSLYEGFGIPPLEAMASGVPVVCSNNTSLPEVVGDAAVLVDPLDVDSIAAGIDRALGDAVVRDQCRARGLARVRSFDWNEAARQTRHALLEVAGDA